MIIALATLLIPLPEELLEDVDVLDGELASAIGVAVSVTEVEAIEVDDTALLEVVLLCDDVVEELEALDVIVEELEEEDVGSLMRTQIWPTTFKEVLASIRLHESCIQVVAFDTVELCAEFPLSSAQKQL